MLSAANISERGYTTSVCRDDVACRPQDERCPRVEDTSARQHRNSLIDGPTSQGNADACGMGSRVVECLVVFAVGGELVEWLTGRNRLSERDDLLVLTVGPAVLDQGCSYADICYGPPYLSLIKCRVVTTFTKRLGLCDRILSVLLSDFSL